VGGGGGGSLKEAGEFLGKREKGERGLLYQALEGKRIVFAGRWERPWGHAQTKNSCSSSVIVAKRTRKKRRYKRARGEGKGSPLHDAHRQGKKADDPGREKRK